MDKSQFRGPSALSNHTLDWYAAPQGEVCEFHSEPEPAEYSGYKKDGTLAYSQCGFCFSRYRDGANAGDGPRLD